MYHLLPTLCSVLFVSSSPAIRVTNHPITHQHIFYNVFSHQLRVQSLKGPHSHYPPVHRLFCPQQHWDCLAWSSIFHDAPTHPVHESFCLPELFRCLGHRIQQPPWRCLQHQTYSTHLLVITNMILSVETQEFAFPAFRPTYILAPWGRVGQGQGSEETAANIEEWLITSVCSLL